MAEYQEGQGMGTWDEGILDNDSALDGLGDISHGIVQDIAALQAAETDPETVGRLAAAIGVLLQFSPFDFTEASGNATKIIEALNKHKEGIDAHLSKDAQGVLSEVAAGKGESLAQRSIELPKDVMDAVHSHATASNFAKREAPLFELQAGQNYVRELSQRIVELVSEDFEDDDTLSDLCREAASMGPLSLLLVLKPLTVPKSTIQSWRDGAQKGLKTLEAMGEEAGELGFHRPYYKNVDIVFAALLQ
ncbi:MAG: hypothetical protein P1V97_07645 [Planctomycetota bacterium]|nr:hypothetical protein [Planctomycetota bacterium]